MFSKAICKICIKNVECREYRSVGHCAIQDEVFKELTAIEELSTDAVLAACENTMESKTTAWYAQAYILRKDLCRTVGEIARICHRSESATYTALHRANELLIYDKRFNARLLLAYRRMKKG